jgi:hypothetical protein
MTNEQKPTAAEQMLAAREAYQEIFAKGVANVTDAEWAEAVGLVQAVIAKAKGVA